MSNTVRLNVRTRLLLWLLASTLPIFAAGLIIVDRVSDRLSDDVAQELTNLVVVEAQHIRSVLGETETDGGSMASSRRLYRALESIPAAVGDPAADVVLNGLAGDLLDNALVAGNGVEGVRITDRRSLVRGETEGFRSLEGWIATTETAMEERRPVFSQAFPTEDRGERIGLAVPVVTPDGSVVGSLFLETALGLLVSSLPTYEDFGETTEATLVQRTDGEAVQVISIRRFERDSAFEREHASTEQIPSVVSMTVDRPTVLHLRDYRGNETIAAVTHIEPLGWGLTMKMDKDEALSISDQISGYILLASALTVSVMLAAWLTFVRPLGRRLRDTADASDRVAQGDYKSLLGDDRSDEIGELSRSIDRLATDLKDDIAARQKVEAELRFQANHDELTGLVNRQRATAVVDGFGDDALFSLLFIDLDRFKQVNDTYGHAVGDELLSVVAQRLESRLPPDGILSRWGGDEFLAILPGVDEAERTVIATRLGDAFGDEIATATGHYSIGMSIGGATSAADVDHSDVIASADAEMFRMKRNRASAAAVPAEVVRMVEAALADDRVEPFYQPVVRVDDHGAVHLHGVEALVRIRDHDGTVLSPADFLPALGDHPLAARIDFRVIRRSMIDVANWHRQGVVPSDFSVALNVGPAAMRRPDLTATIANEAHRNHLDPGLILIEIPETVQTVDPATITGLRGIGVQIAIDDVGVQFSNLERMVDIEADVAKLDRRWIPSMATAEVSKSEVLRTLVDQCNSLELDIIAEGIETPKQLEMLQALGVDLYQGFLFGRPLSVPDFEPAWCRSDAASFRGVS